MGIITRLLTFPVPVAGESFQSVVARNLRRSPGPRQEHLNRLSLKGTPAHTVAPNKLQALTAALPAGHPWADAPDVIIHHHTLVPLQLHFAEPNVASRTIDRICSGGSSNVTATLGMTVRAGQGGPRGHKFCSECVANDVVSKGFSVEYRAHQPDFVMVCAIHGRSLQWSCRRCLKRSTNSALILWEMAGRCGCDSPYTPDACDDGLDAQALEGLSWLAQQVNTILSDGAVVDEEKSRASGLLELLRSSASYRANSGLDSDAIKRALTGRYGASLFKALGAMNLVDESSSRWPSRLMGSNYLDGRQIPDVLKSILLVGLVAPSISKFWEEVARPSAIGHADLSEPKGYARRAKTGRCMLSIDDIQSALILANGRLSAAAAMLKVSSSVLATNMLHLGVPCPLSVKALERLGRGRVERTKDALRSGVAKKQVMSDLGLSEWSLTLIELDDLSLRWAHRDATVDSQRMRHREALLSHFAKSPDASRSSVYENCVSTIDWLRRFDREWLQEHLPARISVPVRQSSRRSYTDWTVVDAEMVMLVAKVAQAELASEKRPVWLSSTYLLKAVQKEASRPPWNKERTPGVWHAVTTHVESRENFLRRKIQWALKQHAVDHKPVSINTLRRTAAMAPSVLIAHKGYVQKCAAELELMIDARCALSPMRET